MMVMKIVEHVSLGTKTVEREYTDEEILELFPDGDGSLVNPLLRRAQRAEAEVAWLHGVIAAGSTAINKKIPRVGDSYTDCFQSDLDTAPARVALSQLTIDSVEFETDEPGTWCITASDGCGYDCCWSDRHQIWCYNLQ